MNVTAAAMSSAALRARLLADLRPHAGAVVGMFVLGIAATPLALLAPLPVKLAVDQLAGTAPPPAFLTAVLPPALLDSAEGVLALAAGLLVLVAALTQVQAAATTVLRARTTASMVEGLRARLFDHVQRLSPGFFDQRGTPDVLFRIQYDAVSLPAVVLDGLIPLVSSALTLVAMLWVTFALDATLALVAMGISPLLFVLSRAYRTRLRRGSREAKALESRAFEVVHETLGALRLVVASGQQEREHARFRERADAGIEARVAVARAEGWLGFLIGLLLAGGTAAVLFVGARHVQDGTLGLGDLVLVMGYLAQLYAPLKTMSRKVGSLQSHLAGVERAYALLDEVPEVVERPDARPLQRARGGIEFRGVDFAYEPGRRGLSTVDFAVAPGGRVGIVGRTGAGKSTLTSLMVRFYDPTAGAVLLDGTDLREYRLADLRRQFALVQQEPVLFSASAAENIAYARPGAPQQDIEAAARAANAHAFIEKLPQGYATELGERGMRLSGGERQRIALARAFLKDAPVLILDEPTSAVDVETEADILDAIERLMQGRTTFLVAHRDSTLRGCGRILRVEDGAVHEEAAPGPAGAAARSPGAPDGVVPDDRRLGELLTGALAGPVEVVARRQHVLSSTHPIEVVDVRRAGEPVRRVVCKFAPHTAVDRDRGRGGIEYEGRVYRDVLAPLGVRSPALLGAVRVPESGLFALVLEHVGSEQRLGTGTARELLRTAEWLGAFHRRAEGWGAGGRRGSAEQPFLLEITEDRCAYWWEQAKARLQPLADGEPWLDAIGARYRAGVAALLQSPATVCHGEFYPNNVLLLDGEPVPIDWETAALGPGELDLAALVEGWDSAPEAVAGYCRTRWSGAAPPGFARAFDAARIYWHLRWLGDPSCWRPSKAPRRRIARLRELLQEQQPA